MATVLPQGKQYFENSAGQPLAGGRLYTFLAGTSTPKATYADQAATVPNANPITLDARGEALVYWSGAYKVELRDAANSLLWTVDNIFLDAGEFIFDGSPISAFFKSKNNLVVDSIAALRAVDKTKFTRTFVTGYYTVGDGGGGSYWYDPSDVASADNGGTIIVAADGGRWKATTQSPVSFEVFGARGDGVVDDTARMQAALLCGATLITAAPEKTYKTTDTLFLKANNTVVDFNGSTITNTSNSMYAICLVTAAIATLTEAALINVLTTLHYGAEVQNSEIKNLVISMSPTSGGGNNLGAGIVYGKNCRLTNIRVNQTNGNGLEVRNSTDCTVSNAYLTPRTYGAFFFMTKNCAMSDSYISGCARGIITKMSQAGAPVLFRATRCKVENLSSDLYYAVGGEWKERVLTDPIYQAGHEIVTDNVYEDCTFRSDTNQVKLDIAYWAARFIFRNCLISSVTSAAGANIGADGNPIGGDVQGKNHEFNGCSFVNATTATNSALTVGADTKFDSCTFLGAYQRLMTTDSAYAPIVDFTNNIVRGNLQTINNQANCLLSRLGSAVLNVTDNVFTLALVSSGNGAETDSGIANYPSIFSRNVIKITGAGAYTHTSAYVFDGMCYDNNLYYSNIGGSIFALRIEGAADVQNNILGNNGTVGAGSRGIYMPSATVEVVRNEGNYVSGTWAFLQFANLPQNYQYANRIKTGSAAPVAGTWARGDRVFNDTPTVGQPKSWVCTAAGTPGTWVSEGNL